MKNEVEATYARAKQGDWTAVLAAWSDDPNLAAECAHYVKAVIRVDLPAPGRLLRP